MDSDLISRSDLLTRMCQENCGERQCVDAMDRCVWYYYIKQQPTADAVEVVRCERCEFWINEMYSNHLEGYCEIQERCTEYDEFCSHGTKMDGGDKE